MSEAILRSTLVTLMLAPVAEGKATRYDPGVMDAVVANRVAWGQIDTNQLHGGYVALTESAYIGDRAWILWPDGNMTGPYIVADCAAAHDIPRLKQIDFAVDVSYEIAQKHFSNVDAPEQGVKVYIERLWTNLVQ